MTVTISCLEFLSFFLLDYERVSAGIEPPKKRCRVSQFPDAPWNCFRLRSSEIARGGGALKDLQRGGGALELSGLCVVDIS